MLKICTPPPLISRTHGTTGPMLLHWTRVRVSAGWNQNSLVFISVLYISRPNSQSELTSCFTCQSHFSLWTCDTLLNIKVQQVLWCRSLFRHINYCMNELKDHTECDVLTYCMDMPLHPDALCETWPKANK
jgi:hypothetical protein